MTKIFLQIIFFLSTLLLASVVFAQSSEEGIAKKYGITFPVAELGGSQSLEECKTFCSKEENKDVCISYAKKKGFYHQSSEGRDHQDYQQHSSKDNEEILKLAKIELGCNSYDDCMALCELESNRKKCEDFALSHDLMVGKQADQMKQVMSKLGCNSPASCMSFCSSPANMQKCMVAFQSAGFDTGVHNMTLDQCKKLSPPDWECRLDGQTCTCQSPQEPPEVWCSKSGPDCKWKDNTCFCGETIEEYCTKQPGCRLEGNSCICEGSQSATPVYDIPTYGTPIYYTPNPESELQASQSAVQGISTKSLLQTVLDFLGI